MPYGRAARAGRDAPRGPVLLACETCEARLAKEGRFRQIGQLRQALDTLGAEAHASESGLQILPVACLDVCPRGAMAVAIGATRGRGPAEILVVRTPDELKSICAGLTTTYAVPALIATDLAREDQPVSQSTPDMPV